MSRGSAEVCVLGAGLTGATVALELARRGVDVTLVDRDPQPLNRASLRNEGKIHLGFVFAKDDILATPKLMLDGALRFRRILRRVIGEQVDLVPTSTPFTYLVSKDSLLTPAQLEERYAAIEGLYLERLRADPDSDYLGRQPDTLFRRAQLDDLSACFRTDCLLGAFQTEELAIDTQALAEAVRHAVADSPHIRFIGNRQVTAVERRSGQFCVKGMSPEGAWRLEALQVVNALWDDRIRVDRTIGIEHAAGWLHRLKYRVIARVPQRLRGGPSATMVLGPYGDVVIKRDGTGYFSWYPVGLKGWTHATSPPASWMKPCAGVVSEQSAATISDSILKAIEGWYPGAAECEPILVDAGVIVAYGKSDVDDPASGLHNRTRVGVIAVDGYVSVDPGKLTTAPLFAVQAAEQVLGSKITA